MPTYIDYLYLINSLGGYSYPKARLTRMIKTGEITKVKRGLYVSPSSTAFSLKTLANKIYGPSYISFEYALSWYGLIPERVHTITSASMGKNKTRIFSTPLGAFSYQSIMAGVYPYGISRMDEDGSPFLVATKEKAICDLLSKRGGLTSIKELKTVIYEDLRIEENMLFSLNPGDIEFLAPLYGKTAVSLLLRYLQKGGGHA
ncbi:MAG: hypothetical protein A2219_05685 [Elusimicrobia bacterium RIFOXYA2_FULL_50_26]|nr:MAG: hypothetical protein A2219_05685 [Elusimicrobia bacterium RIFOXYA2_FULL_50_26]